MSGMVVLLTIVIDIMSTIEKHRLEPQTTIDEYIKTLRLGLGEDIRNFKKIYLDTNYWIELRNVIQQKQDDKLFIDLLELLRNGVKENKLLCPISDEIFDEILKQSDLLTLKVTANLIDELSKGVSILSSQERMKFEILYFIHKLTKKSTYSPNIFVWTKLSLSYGTSYPKITLFSTEEELAIQKAFFDHLWSISLTEMIGVMGIDKILKMPRYNDISEELNRNKLKYASENNSFKKLLISEIGGVIDLYKPLFEEALSYLFEHETGQKISKDDVIASNPGQMANLIYFIFEKNQLGEYFPSIVISANLHASVRHNLPRKYKPNDIPDFRHAQAALPYYDYFFTDHSLRDLICRKNIYLDKKYNCEVFSDPYRAVECVKKILQ